jgi:hypothetical protein
LVGFFIHSSAHERRRKSKTEQLFQLEGVGTFYRARSAWEKKKRRDFFVKVGTQKKRDSRRRRGRGRGKELCVFG